MADFRFDFEWVLYPDDDLKVGETTAQLEIHVDGLCLTRNEDAWSRTVREYVIVSLYPLAMWFASSWWRLNHEILPSDARMCLAHDWRMSHELAAANMGFVWPNLILAPDLDEMRIWAQASQARGQTPVKYLHGLSRSRTVPRERFVHEVSSFINHVVARLHESGLHDSELAQLWTLILEDQTNPGECQKRRIEAELGFDPEEGPAALIRQAISLEEMVGSASFSELAGAYAGSKGNRIEAMSELIASNGIVGKPDIPIMDFDQPVRKPWKRAVSAAHELRQQIGEPGGALSNDVLYNLLGLSKRDVENWCPSGRTKASVAEAAERQNVKFIPRKKHPVSGRFELARFIADYARSRKLDPKSWLVTADLSTARQKFQRAFAAEFLCPISSLVEFLDGDFSESALEDAADHFAVSEQTIEALLMNNGYFSRPSLEADMPYDLAWDRSSHKLIDSFSNP